MTKKEIKKILGLNDENFDFYIEMGDIRKVGRNKYEYDKKLENSILEKSTVFKYSFEDSFYEDIKEHIDVVKYTSKVKRFNKEEIRRLEDEMKRNGSLDKKKK